MRIGDGNSLMSMGAPGLSHRLHEFLVSAAPGQCPRRRSVCQRGLEIRIHPRTHTTQPVSRWSLRWGLNGRGSAVRFSGADASEKARMVGYKNGAEKINLNYDESTLLHTKLTIVRAYAALLKITWRCS